MVRIRPPPAESQAKSMLERVAREVRLGARQDSVALEAGPDLRSSKLSLTSSARRQGASSRDCLQIVAHNGASRCAASDHLESRACEGSGGTGKDIRCALRCACVDRITFERRRPRALCGLQSREDKLSHDPLPAIASSHEETEIDQTGTVSTRANHHM